MQEDSLSYGKPLTTKGVLKLEDVLQKVNSWSAPLHLQQSLWRGIRVGPVKLVLYEKAETLLHGLLQGSESNPGLMFWPLTEDLSQLLGISRSKVIQMLKGQGLNSLGTKIASLVEDILATLFVCVVLMKLRYHKNYGKQVTITMDTDVTVDTQGFWDVYIEGKIVELHPSFVPVYKWLQQQELQFGHLYSVLELANCRKDFICKVCRIFDDI